eukprot:TRINITY_DN14025_c0_g1_i5.p1 TRINITY_DN14025_c0_g1~~TRINITY_DN14025_c0_g1_i5.p1  ORF type:complete len:537 (+),score=42.12 TRINITY_DN14025_c0_g1_i5:123-1733(+)
MLALASICTLASSLYSVGANRHERGPQMCTELIEKPHCVYKEGVFLKVVGCVYYHRNVGDEVADKCSKPAEKYDLSDCTWLQVRHYPHIHRPPLPYIQGVQTMEQQNGNLFIKGAQVLTDIDDTIKCSGGHQPAGIDSTCKNTDVGALYPGVVGFYKALTLGHQGPSTIVPAERFPIPLSARPRALSLLLGMKRCKKVDLFFRQLACDGSCTLFTCHQNYRKFRRRKENECSCFGLNTKAAQYGELLDYATDRENEHIYERFKQKEESERSPVFESGGYAKMAFSKFNGFLNLVKTLKKPVPMVFVGDNGQGDFSAAQMMLRFKDTHGHHHMHAAFIHYVRKDMDPDSAQFTAAQKAWGKQRIYVFRDYMEAARIALENHIISNDQFEVVRESYKKDLKRVSSMVANDDDVEDDPSSGRADASRDDESLEERVSPEDAKQAREEYKRFLELVQKDDLDGCSAHPHLPKRASSKSSQIRSASQPSRNRRSSKGPDHGGGHHDGTRSTGSSQKRGASERGQSRSVSEGHSGGHHGSRG